MVESGPMARAGAGKDAAGSQSMSHMAQKDVRGVQQAQKKRSQHNSHATLLTFDTLDVPPWRTNGNNASVTVVCTFLFLVVSQ